MLVVPMLLLVVVGIITTDQLTFFPGYSFTKQSGHQSPEVKISGGMAIMLVLLMLLPFGDGGDHHHHPPSHTHSWVPVWKAVLTPKPRSENLKGIAIMLVVLMLLLVGDGGDHHHHPPCYILSWVPV